MLTGRHVVLKGGGLETRCGHGPHVRMCSRRSANYLPCTRPGGATATRNMRRSGMAAAMPEEAVRQASQAAPSSSSPSHRGRPVCRTGTGGLAPQLLAAAAAALSFSLLTSGPLEATAAATMVDPGVVTATTTAAAATTSISSSSSGDAPAAGLQTVYFGNGCFWGRQKDFVDVETSELGRPASAVSAVVGYAGGTAAGPGNKVCYFYSDPRTVYERLGHAEVVALDVRDQQEFGAFAKRYFEQFRKTPYGMIRSDPQDQGPGYRNVVGIPGGVSGPLFPLLKAANVYGMELKEGHGNGPQQVQEDDLVNVVWVVDSTRLPFYRAERYHQFHNGLGKRFNKDYLEDLKAAVAQTGKIDPTGCFEKPF